MSAPTTIDQSNQIDEPEYVPTSFDRLTMELCEIRMLAEVIDSVEEGAIPVEHASLLARLIVQKIDAAEEHAKAVFEGGAR